MKLIERIAASFVKVIGSLEWERLRERLTGRRFALDFQDASMIFDALSKGPHVVLTWRRSHMSSYFVVLGHLLLTGRWVPWSHVLIVFHDEKEKRFRILEATGTGVKLSEFWDAFNVDGCVLLSPRISKGFDWNAALIEGIENVGKGYDNLCRLEDGAEMNCGEVVLDALKKDPEFSARFHGLEAMIRNEGNLTPQMFLECGSFDEILRIRR